MTTTSLVPRYQVHKSVGKHGLGQGHQLLGWMEVQQLLYTIAYQLHRSYLLTQLPNCVLLLQELSQSCDFLSLDCVTIPAQDTQTACL